jgi:hypothetical protein
VLEFHRLQGDVDGNMVVNASDMNVVNASLGATLTTATWNANADLDRDERVTVRDRLIVARADGHAIVPPAVPAPATAGLPGDFNADGSVDSGDYVVWRKNVGRTNIGSFLAGDATGDGVVDSLDFQIWKQNFGRTRVVATSQPNDSAASATVNFIGGSDTGKFESSSQHAAIAARDQVFNTLSNAVQDWLMRFDRLVPRPRLATTPVVRKSEQHFLLDQPNRVEQPLAYVAERPKGSMLSKVGKRHDELTAEDNFYEALGKDDGAASRLAVRRSLRPVGAR